MAQIVITIPDAQIARVRDAIATRFGWTVESGLTKTQFAQKVVREWLRSEVRLEEIRKAQITAADTVVDVDVS